MLVWMLAKVGAKSLWANKLRSFLAVLGIIIGVGAVISMLALGAGTRSQILSRVSSLGTNLLVVRPGQAGQRGIVSGTAQTMTLDDAEAIAREIDGVEWVAPVTSGTVQLKYFNKNTRPRISAVTASYLPVRGFEIERGRNFTETEVDNRRRVVILGSTTAENLFGQSDPLGEMIKLKGVSYRVVGILKTKGDQGWFNPDDQALIPLETGMKQVFGVDRLQEIDVLVSENAENGKVVEQIEALLRKRHRTAPDAESDFTIRDQAEIVGMATTFSSIFTALLGSLASISLLVGGIGIMNIMLVTVAERTREIGLRKAIGAREKDILRQFLFESVMVSGLGGAMGIAAGIALALLIPFVVSFFEAEFPTLIEPWSIMLAFGVSVAVGVFFGYYPARRAAKLDPIEALRHE